MKIKYFDQNKKTKFLNGLTMINMQNMYGNTGSMLMVQYIINLHC